MPAGSRKFAAQAATDRSHRAALARAVGWTSVAVVLTAVLAAVAAVAFSVTVAGDSMQPTLRPGDRLVADVLHRDDVQRFDVVEATVGTARAAVVKRVIGIPGDRVLVRTRDGHPEVLVRPAGSSVVFRVENSAWSAPPTAEIEGCCDADGRSQPRPAWARVPDGAYWLLGDNWGASTDSRTFGFVRAEAIGARLSFRLTPLGDLGDVPNPARLVATS